MLIFVPIEYHNSKIMKLQGLTMNKWSLLNNVFVKRKQKAYFHIKLKPLLQLQNSTEKQFLIIFLSIYLFFFLKKMVYKKNVSCDRAGCAL